MKQINDAWHYPRTETATKLVHALNVGAVNSFVIFAPQRIGKTEFLLRDLKPLAEQNNYHVIYFNFHANSHNKDSVDSFLEELRHEVNNGILSKIDIKEVNLPWCRINLNIQKVEDLDINQLLGLLILKLECKDKKLLLLLDEIQELSFKEHQAWFVGALRTALDTNKQNISVVFTGSSRIGLTKMFQDAKAPFFHFSSNFEFEYFSKSFTDFLANRYHAITQKTLDGDALYEIFCRLGRVTLYIREIINILVLNPDNSPLEAYEYYTSQISGPDKYQELWDNFSKVEKGIFIAIVHNISQLYSKSFAELIAKYGLNATRGQLQYAIKKLVNNSFITTDLNNNYEIMDPHLRQWIKDNQVTILRN